MEEIHRPTQKRKFDEPFDPIKLRENTFFRELHQEIVSDPDGSKLLGGDNQTI